MNRFFRSALFPLVIIAALVWLALQTLGGSNTKHDAVDDVAVHPGGRTPGRSSSIPASPVTIDPNKQSISATLEPTATSQ